MVAKTELFQGLECHPVNLSPGSWALVAGGLLAPLLQARVVRGRLSFPWARGRQGLWGTHPELYTPSHPQLSPVALLPPPPAGLLTSLPLHISACAPSPSPPHAVTATPPPRCLLPDEDTQAAGGGGGRQDVLQGPVGTSRGCAYSFLLFPRGPWPPWVTKLAPLPASRSPPPHCPVHEVPGNPGNQWLLYSLEGRHFTLGENPLGGREQPLLCSDPSVAHCSS